MTILIKINDLLFGLFLSVNKLIAQFLNELVNSSTLHNIKTKINAQI